MYGPFNNIIVTKINLGEGHPMGYALEDIKYENSRYKYTGNFVVIELIGKDIRSHVIYPLASIKNIVINSKT
jgi:hypothetical protein